MAKKEQKGGLLLKIFENLKYMPIYRLFRQTLVVTSQFGVADSIPDVYIVSKRVPEALDGRKYNFFMKILEFQNFENS